jgi:hypothetical protein
MSSRLPVGTAWRWTFSAEFPARLAKAAITFLLMNDREPAFREDALVDAVLAVASSSMTKQGLVQFFEPPCVPRADAQG